MDLMKLMVWSCPVCGNWVKGVVGDEPPDPCCDDEPMIEEDREVAIETYFEALREDKLGL